MHRLEAGATSLSVRNASADDMIRDLPPADAASNYMNVTSGAAARAAPTDDAGAPPPIVPVKSCVPFSVPPPTMETN